MQSTLLATVNLVAMFLGCACLGHAIALAHWRRKGSASVILLIILCGQIWLVPQAINYFIFQSTRLLYPLWFGNWIVLAFGMILFPLTLRGTPRDLLDAARLDGIESFGLYRHVTWPTLKPALAAIAIFLFLATWSEFVRPLFPGLALGADPLRVPTTTQEIIMMIGASFLATLPIIAIFLFAQRHFLRGSASEMKG